MSEMHDPYEDQLAAARYRAERDQARQECERLRARMNFDFWLSGRVMHELGFDEDMADRDEVERRLLARLMPEGMEWLVEVWPKWSNGEYCKFGDWWKSDKYGEPEPRQFRKLSIYTPDQLREWGQDDGESYGYEWDFMRPSDPKYRPDKVEPPAPKVLDADGVEIRVGDTVYSAEDGTEYEVCEAKLPRVTVEYLAAGIPAHSSIVPSLLTHERPDSWERLEDDATIAPVSYCVDRCLPCCEVRQGDPEPDLADFTEAMARDLVRRARALAERERGE